MVENNSNNLEDSGVKMDQLYTIDEMMVFFKVSRGTIYNYMIDGILPFVEIRGQRRFIGSQVIKAIKDMQIKQVQERVRGQSGLVLKDTLSDVSQKLANVNTNANQDLKKQQKASYKIRNSKLKQRKPR